jgi:hypothetical protein
MRKWFLGVAAVAVVLVAAMVTRLYQPACDPVDGAALAPAQAEQVIAQRAQAAVQALRDKNWAALSAMGHPEKGVRFSQYGHVNAKDLVFPAEQLKTAYADKRLYEWGTFDGSGEPIQLSFADYYARFVYGADFAAAPQKGYNQAIGRGNTIDNAREFYPQAVIVEYHYPGFDPKYEGIDWQSLRLVFEQKGCDWYLVGVIHAQWTI